MDIEITWNVLIAYKKRIFSEVNTSRVPELQTKETKMKDVFYDVYRSIWILHQEMIST